ncbi:hypothetical protein MB02_10975 [Croceicoccus estronivorus]|uniref:hypothetical protein n=1 Tax=Croceicoccus estronivorus TaxID=1172626 RepID=UPI000831E84C|nr:hypothetical protein [Croceicoccus estronivorus]OCC23677.1 hypothetical protein MB02_10975 [Croceicoccus estronivorus]
MHETFDPTTWSATLLGLFTLFAAVGALRKPGIWQTLVDEIEKSPALQLISGGLEMLVGAVIYLANPWVPSDLLACVMKALAGLMMLEALAVLGFSDIYFQFWLRNLSFMHRGWAIVTFLCGFGLTVAGLFRFT